MVIDTRERHCDRCGDTLLFRESKDKYSYEAVCENCEEGKEE